MTKIIDGKQIAADLSVELKQEVAQLKAQNVVPGLAVILVGDDPASKVYVRNKKRRAEELGINFRLIELPVDILEAELLTEIEKLNQDETIDGMLVQLPLPAQIDEDKVVNAVSPAKDVDGFAPINFGHLWQDDPTIIPSTAGGIMTLLDKSEILVAGKDVLIINRSKIVGRPLAALLLNADATVTLAHSHTKNLAEKIKNADIIVSAVGQANFITGEMVKPTAVVIDVGMNRDEQQKLVGDVDFDSVADKVAAITPVPGGVGPMTIITLMQQLIEIAKKRVVHG